MEKELVWMPKHLAEKIKQMEKDGALDSFVLEHIETCKKEIQTDIEAMEDDVLRFRGLLAQVRKDFGEATEEHLSKAYEVWESFDKDLPSIRKHVDAAVKELLPLKKELSEITEAINGINTWKAQRLAEDVQNLSALLNGSNKDMIKFLIDNYKEEKA